MIRRRLAALSEEANRLLALASVLGRDFDVEALGRLSGKASSDVLAVLEEPMTAKIVSDTHGALGRLHFSHALVLRCIRAHVAAELGRKQEAREELHSLAADGFAAVPQNDDWLFAL